MIGSLFQTITTTITQFGSCLGSALSSVTSMFYDGEALTMLGTLGLIGVGIGLVYFAFRLIRSLMRLR